jgi:aldose 1-epimerase
MTSITISDDATGATAAIAPQRGFNCYSFRAPVLGQTVEVLDSEPAFLSGTTRPTRSGIPILFPFPNRIREGRFTWNRHEFAIPASDSNGNAIHGFCADRPWRVVRQGKNFVAGQFQLSVDAPERLDFWPSDFRMEVEYRLVRNRLRASFSILNHSREPMPWGLGTHPYFRTPIGAEGQRDACTIEVPGRELWELAENLPTGRRLPVDEANDLRCGRSLAGLNVDAVYTGLEFDGPQFDCVVMDERSGIQVTQTCPPIFREVVAFTPPNRDCVCLEPYTCVTDAVNLQERGIDAGLRVLPPGGEFRTWIDLSVGPILA